MSLVTPDTGLLFWMVLIFGIVFFILAKFGFPIITGMVDKRNSRIQDSLREAREIEQRMADILKEQQTIIEQARKEQASILRDASEAKKNIIEQARVQADDEARKIVAEARTQIAVEKESAMRDIRRQAALLSVSIAEKVLRSKLSSEEYQLEYLERLADEAGKTNADKS